VIAKQELGNGARWKEIYDANRDQLSSPEALHTGIKLRLP
jgi:nucleoid-associated protein YgaU